MRREKWSREQQTTIPSQPIQKPIKTLIVRLSFENPSAAAAAV